MQHSRILIQNAQTVDFVNRCVQKNDIYIEEGYIHQIGQNLDVKKDCFTIDAKSSMVIPGMVDLCARTSLDNLSKLNTVLYKNGIQLACVNVSHDLYLQNIHLFDHWMKQTSNHCKIFPILPMGINGKMAPILSLQKSGVKAFSNQGTNGLSLSAVTNIFRYLSDTKLPVMIDLNDHAECPGALHDGPSAYWMGLRSSSKIEESVWVSYYIELSYLTKVPVHFRTITSARSVELILHAKSDGLPISCDVSILHLLFTDEHTKGFDQKFHIQPPFRSSCDQDALIEGLSNGSIDSISSLHGAKMYNSLSAYEDCWSVAPNFWPFLYHLITMKKLDLVRAIESATLAPKFLPTHQCFDIQTGQYVNLCICDTEQLDSIQTKNSFTQNQLEKNFVQYVISGNCLLKNA